MGYVRDELLKNESDLQGRFEQALVRVERGPLMVQTRSTRISIRTSHTASDANENTDNKGSNPS